MQNNQSLFIAYIIGGVATISILAKLKFLYHPIDPSLAEVAKKKLNSRNNEIEEFKGKHPISKLSPAKLKLIHACKNSSDILALYKENRAKAQDVILYYIYAALAANEKTNCLTEVMFQEALEAAEKLDKHFEETGELYGPLHGLPVSLKDCISYSGKDSTIGVIKLSFKPKESHSVVVRQLIDAGAIPFVKTNLPQTMMTFECTNPLWGNTDNPAKSGFSPGGSSGGEGALIVTLEAACESLLISLVFAHSFKDEEVASVRKLRFGIARTDGFAHPVPAVSRALDIAKEALVKSGHGVVEFVYPLNTLNLVKLYSSIINADGGHHMLETLLGEPLDRGVKPVLLASKMDWMLRDGLTSIMCSIFADERFTAMLNTIGEKPVRDLMVLEKMRIDAQHEFDALWKTAGIDALLCPPNAMPAIPYGSFNELAFTASYTFIWNLLDYTAGVLPVTEVDSSKDAYPSDFVKPSGSIFKEDFIESSIHKYYDPEQMEGLPVGVQIVGLPYHEELVLNAMKALETALKSS